MGENLLGNATFSAIVGGLAGGVTSWIISIRSEASGRRYAKYNAVELVVDDLQCVSKKYWKKAGSDAVLETEIKASLERLDLKIQSLLRLLNRSSIEVVVNGYMDELTDEITGGDFESSNRRKDSVRVMRVDRICGGIRDYLHGKI
jgi:hypothetical protein